MKTEDINKNEFVNREISWLYFNHRVLQESANPDVPLIERLKFLGIYSNNLDEFFRVRVATLQRMVDMNLKMVSSNDNPAEILKQISRMTSTTQAEVEDNYCNIKKELKEENICIVNEDELTETQKEFVINYYDTQLEDAITPIMLSAQRKSKFPRMEDARIYFLVRLSERKNPNKQQYALIEMPGSQFSRFLELPEENGKKYVILLDDVIRLCIPMLFKSLNYDTFETYTIKITRDSEMEIQDEELDDGLIERVSKGIKSRKYGLPLRLVYDKEMPADMLNYLLDKIKFIKSGTVISSGRYHNFKDFMGFPTLGKKDLVYPKNQRVENRVIADSQSVMKAIQKRDHFLHYPFYNFSQYVQLLREAAIDPKVKSIHITIYRMASKSKVAKALIFAAKNGKEVTAVVELRARFDEEHNIQWAERMKEAGVKVHFGVEGLKIHSKLTLITKKNNKKVAAISTGNFHEGNAAVYTDITLLTANEMITKEVEQVFKFIEKPYLRLDFQHLLVSPQRMRNQLTEMVENEMVNVKKGLPAYILVKINHITDYQFIQKLYKAAEAGVKIHAVVRGLCSIVSTLEKLHNNIKIVGIVDKFLEHSRIFIFCNNGNEKYYISSADWMTRNLDNRIEVAAPIYDKNIQKELKTIISYGLDDNVQGRVCNGTGKNEIQENGKAPFRSQFELMKHYTELEGKG